ncbi:ABC transporter permease [Streptosporangiaceae bacterium NEAU-GS5]|nr:ABC transporter permease [Streptosporangiaceae bacterium NEAU-GS5]
MGSLLNVTPALGLIVVFLAVGGAAVAWLGHLGHARDILTASVRATVQLGVISLVITWVVGAAAGTAAFLLIMYGVAAVTAGRRISRTNPWPAALPIAAGTLPVAALLFGAGVAPLKGVVVIPIVGILLGGCLTATALSGARAMEELTHRRGEVEAALSLGFLPREANLEICRPAAARALVPALDQTRTVGLVTLPGAFVGMLLGGADPLHAGIVQLVVLVALLAAEAVAVLLTLELVAREHFQKRVPGV